MNKSKNDSLAYLQLFAEEGEAATAVGSNTGAIGDAATTAEPAADTGVATGAAAQQAAPATASDEGAETFDSLIKGKYKKEYDAHMKSAFKDRFKKQTQAQQSLQNQINRIDPVVRMIAGKYGIAPGTDGSIDIGALEAKMQADDSLLEKEAFDRGVSVDNLRQLKSIEARERSLQQMEQQARQQQQFAQIEAEGDALKQMYDSFDLDTEMADPNFASMVATLANSGFPNPVRTAYESIHRDQIMQNAMQYATEQAASKVAASVASGKSRPKENGTGSRASGTTSVDLSKLSPQQINDYIARSRRGEKITFK